MLRHEGNRSMRAVRLSVPATCCGGDTIEFEGPSGGRCTVIVPLGLAAGDEFEVEAPEPEQAARNETLTVVIPPGVGPGEAIEVPRGRGDSIVVEVPPGLYEGMEMSVVITEPASATSPTASPTATPTGSPGPSRRASDSPGLASPQSPISSPELLRRRPDSPLAAWRSDSPLAAASHRSGGAGLLGPWLADEPGERRDRDEEAWREYAMERVGSREDDAAWREYAFERVGSREATKHHLRAASGARRRGGGESSRRDSMEEASGVPGEASGEVREVEVTVPEGLFEGDSFDVETEYGCFQLVVPGGCGPGSAVVAEVAEELFNAYDAAWREYATERVGSREATKHHLRGASGGER
eukprot:4267158-Prymnesium_polylepis.1